jgi:hypothetical protein
MLDIIRRNISALSRRRGRSHIALGSIVYDWSLCEAQIIIRVIDTRP